MRRQANQRPRRLHTRLPPTRLAPTHRIINTQHMQRLNRHQSRLLHHRLQTQRGLRELIIMRALRLTVRHRQMYIHDPSNRKDRHHEREVVRPVVVVLVWIDQPAFVDRGQHFVHQLTPGDAPEEPGGVFEVDFADGERVLPGGQVSVDHRVDFVCGAHGREGEGDREAGDFGVEGWGFGAAA